MEAALSEFAQVARTLAETRPSGGDRVGQEPSRDEARSSSRGKNAESPSDAPSPDGGERQIDSVESDQDAVIILGPDRNRSVHPLRRLADEILPYLRELDDRDWTPEERAERGRDRPQTVDDEGLRYAMGTPIVRSGIVVGLDARQITY